MKKIYFFLSLLLLWFGATAVQAQSHKVVSIGNPLTDISTLQSGQQILLFCQGPTDENHREYQTRYGFVKELNNNKLVISRKLFDKKNNANPNVLGSSLSSAYLWTVESVTPGANGAVSLTLKNDSTERYISTFTGNNAQGATSTTADFFTIEPYAEEGDSIFTIADANNIYFNAVNIDGNGSAGDPANMVGWNQKGDNSNYMIYVPQVEKISSYTVHFYMYDENENMNESVVKVSVGESIAAAPEWEFHDFDAEATAEMDVTFPLTPESDMDEVILMYKSWPTIVINYKDTEGTILKESVSGQFQTGTVFEAPTLIGYVLDTEEYATYTVGTESETIDIIYHADPTANLPFTPTTIVDGKFADNTVWYTIGIGGSQKTVSLNTTTAAVEAGAGASGNNTLWAFVGNLQDGFKIYNKATGTNKILWAGSSDNGEAVIAVTEEDATTPNTFDLVANENGGYSFALHGTTGHMSDYSGAGIVKLWQAADAGCKMRFTAFELPFQTSNITNGEFPEDTQWYLMKIRDTKYIAYNEADGQIKNFTDQNAGLALLWAFTGDIENGFKIYNRVAGADKILWGSNENDETTNSIFLSMEDAETVETPNTFSYIPNGNGFTLKLHGGLDNKYVNDIAGRLGFWQTGAGATDGGGKINFVALSAEDVAELEAAAEEARKNAARAVYLDYLRAENCVGGWTGEELASLKQHLEAEDFTACAADVEALPESSIAFDAEKQYVFFSAAKGFLTAQPTKLYAMYNDGSQVAWKEFDASDASFVWSFEAASDTTYYLKRYDMYIGSYRFQTANGASLVAWAENTAEDGTVAEGLPAAFEMKASEFSPAAFTFDHNFGTDNVWLNLAKGKLDATLTSGNISTYKIDGPEYGSAWRLMDIEAAGIDITGIGNAATIDGNNGTNVIYDLSGRRVQKAVKGLYIVNGKKVLVK